MRKFNVMFDLETLGKSNNAAIVQIGAVKFDFSGNIISKFLRNIDLQTLRSLDFDLDYDTLDFWFRQNDASIKSVFGDLEKTPIKEALNDFIEWIGEPKKTNFWSHSTFDPPILINAFKKAFPSIAPKIQYRNFCDIRTVIELSDFDLNTVQNNGIKHNALDDCIYQVEYLTEALKILLKNSKD